MGKWRAAMSRDKVGKALFDAAIAGSLERTQAALEAGADPNWLNKRDEMESLPLHYASNSGKHEIVEILLTSRADPNARNAHRYTPLHNAARKGHDKVARLLLENFADV